MEFKVGTRHKAIENMFLAFAVIWAFVIQECALKGEGTGKKVVQKTASSNGSLPRHQHTSMAHMPEIYSAIAAAKNLAGEVSGKLLPLGARN